MNFMKFLNKIRIQRFFPGALTKSTGTGDFEFFRKIPCAGDFSFSLYRKTLSFYDKFPVLGIYVFPVLEDFEFLQYYLCTENFYFPYTGNFCFPCTGRLSFFSKHSLYWGFFIFPVPEDFELLR